MDIIITGEIDSGKTTRMRQHFLENSRGDGFICKKTYCDQLCTGYDLERLSDGLSLPFIRLKGEYKQEERTIYSTGKYIFLEASFHRVSELIKEMIESNTDPIYIDELGPLELNREGFYQSVKDIKKHDLSIVTCVRQSCLEGIIELFNLEQVRILEV